MSLFYEVNNIKKLKFKWNGVFSSLKKYLTHVSMEIKKYKVIPENENEKKIIWWKFLYSHHQESNTCFKQLEKNSSRFFTNNLGLERPVLSNPYETLLLCMCSASLIHLVGNNNFPDNWTKFHTSRLIYKVSSSNAAFAKPGIVCILLGQFR